MRCRGVHLDRGTPSARPVEYWYERGMERTPTAEPAADGPCGIGTESAAFAATAPGLAVPQPVWLSAACSGRRSSSTSCRSWSRPRYSSPAILRCSPSWSTSPVESPVCFSARWRCPRDRWPDQRRNPRPPSVPSCQWPPRRRHLHHRASAGHGADVRRPGSSTFSAEFLQSSSQCPPCCLSSADTPGAPPQWASAPAGQLWHRPRAARPPCRT